jgi:hypothetical protein
MSVKGISRSRWWAFLATFAAFLCAVNVFAQAPAAFGGVAPPLSAEELDELVGPIALYPDDLVAIILPASTNPLQIVQADRFLEKRKDDPKAPVNESWDNAVKSLLNYPEVVKTMSNDIEWTASLGEAVVSDQAAVLAAIQTFRRKTQAAGNLKTDEKQVVVVEQEVVKIVPADPQVIYVPQYNPSTMVVAGAYPSWGYYPSPCPVYYYPYAPGAAFASGLVWGAAITAAWSGGRYATNYRGGTANINIDRSVNVGSVNRTNISTARSSSTTQWRSNKQPGQVSGRAGATRVGYSGASAGGAGYSGAGRSSARSTSSVDRQSFSSGANRQGTSGGAFSSSSSGYQARLDSSRGAVSRSSMSSGSASRSFGGGRIGGGGGGRGGRR